MLIKRTKPKILFGLVAATLALTMSLPSTGSISLISAAIAGDGGSDRLDNGTNFGSGTSFGNRDRVRGGRCYSTAYKKKDAIAYCKKALGKKTVKCPGGTPRRWVCT